MNLILILSVFKDKSRQINKDFPYSPFLESFKILWESYYENDIQAEEVPK